MTENKDKSYISKDKTFVLQQPISWGNVVDILSEKYKIEETEEKIILELKENNDV